jgi:tRNA threonylcarbamoyladenosine biosynthesis protein TsaB
MAESTKNTPLLLSFDSSERVATVSISSDHKALAQIDSDAWLAQFSKDDKIGRSTALVSMIQAVMKEANVESSQLAAIALSNGPGTFTGLRVGVVTARMLCYAWKLPVIVVNSLEVAAEKLRRSRGLKAGTKIWSLTNAQRRQVFAAQFEVADNDGLKVVTPQSLFERQAIVDLLEKGDDVTGSGAALFSEMIESKTEVMLPDAATASCDANGVSIVARRRLEAGDFDDVLTIEPIYFRPSAAEEVRLAREATVDF